MGPRYDQQTTSKDETYEFVKKLSKFIMWFSVFTFFVSNPSWLSLFLHSFIAHVSNFPSQVLAHINDKNYIFLLCNGILMILAKSSRRLMSGNSEAVTITANEAPSLLEAEQDREIPVLQNHGLIEMEPEVKENEFPDEENTSDEDEDEAEDEESDEWHLEVGEDEGGEGLVARMSTEDLNRKFEEFIRRMKQEIRIEAQQQLVMV